MNNGSWDREVYGPHTSVCRNIWVHSNGASVRCVRNLVHAGVFAGMIRPVKAGSGMFLSESLRVTDLYESASLNSASGDKVYVFDSYRNENRKVWM